MVAAAILKFIFWAITWFILHIFPPNLTQSLKTGSRSKICHQNSHPLKNLNQLNGYNSDIFERICTKFDTETENEVLEQLFWPSEPISDKIQNSGGRHIEIHILVHNSVNNACTCNEFDTQAESRVLERDLASKLTFAKYLHAAAAILKWVKRQ